MRHRRFAAALAVLALLAQALAPLGPARAERVVICGAGGPATVLIDPASGQPAAPAPLAKEHGCCLAGTHCGGCATVVAGRIAGTPAGNMPAKQPARASPTPARALKTAVRARAPPSTSHV